jgi:hypothetical protein
VASRTKYCESLRCFRSVVKIGLISRKDLHTIYNFLSTALNILDDIEATTNGSVKTHKAQRKNYLVVEVDSHNINVEHGSVVVHDASSFPALRLKYAGYLGSCWIIVLLLSIAITSSMVGRSDAFSCTHKSAMLMHLIISADSPLGSNDTSTSSVHLPSSHNFQACSNFHLTLRYRT